MLEQWIFAIIGDSLRPAGSQILAGDPIADCPDDTFLGLTLSFLPRVTSSGTTFSAASVYGSAWSNPARCL